MFFFLHWPNLDSKFWRFLENYVYYAPNPPPLTRSPDKPMQVLCLGVHRSATISLQRALERLGYGPTYHGFDLFYGDPLHYPAWGRLALRKHYGVPQTTEAKPITAEDFDAILGDSEVILDSAAFAFAEELIEAYPDAKVILNYREDFDAWHRSFVRAMLPLASEIWWPLIGLFESGMWWIYHTHFRIIVPNFLGAPYGSRKMEVATRDNGKQAYKSESSPLSSLAYMSGACGRGRKRGMGRVRGLDGPQCCCPLKNHRSRHTKSFQRVGVCIHDRAIPLH